MLLWGRGEPETLSAAVHSATAGQPTVLVIEGEPGIGKTTLLDELLRRAEPFQLLTADGLEDEDVPFGVLAQWGVRLRTAADGRLPSSFEATQGLRALIDAAAVKGPVLLRLDDLQWADAESVRTLVWLLQRLSGDRLLVAVGTRPLGPGRHSRWQRWLQGSAQAIRVSLTGLTPAHAGALVHTSWPNALGPFIHRLWEHTGGNPLYLRAILAEHDSRSLEDTPVLPAPAEFARLLWVRLGRLPDSAVALLEATAVLGTGWVPLFEAAAVGDLEHPAGAVDVLIGVGLLQTRPRFPDGSIRVAHSLIRSAVYDRMPLSRRQALHAAAARVVSDEGAALDHRMAAAEQYDDALAADFESRARRLHDQRSYRLAAQSLRSASVLTANPRERQRRWLDSLYDSALARDLATVRAALPDVERAADVSRRVLVQGIVAVLEGRWHDAVRILEGGTRTAVGEDDPLIRCRIEVLLAWARVGAGYATELVLDGLERARSTGVEDPAVAPYGLFAQGQAASRLHGPESMLDSLAAMPEIPAAVPAEESYLLAWRGALRTHVGLLDDAVRDLREAQRRVQAGLTDIADGGFHGILGVACWLNGEWDLARMCFRLALDVTDASQNFVLPLVLTYAPLGAAPTGQFTEADRLLDRATSVLEDMPWQEAIQALLIAEVVRLHAGGTRAQQATLLPGTRRRWPRVPLVEGLVGAPFLMHAAISAIWAGELSEAGRLLDRMCGLSPRPAWVSGTVAWLRGLVAEARGDGARAWVLVEAAVGEADAQLPFYRGHVLVDHARLARRRGRLAAAEVSLRRAGEIYRGLGATPYVERVAELLGECPRDSGRPGAGSLLTERERDVLTLVTAGMSYAQIARDLFITRSTVGFHLSNIYAKTGVSSRHELTELVRRDATAFQATTPRTAHPG